MPRKEDRSTPEEENTWLIIQPLQAGEAGYDPGPTAPQPVQLQRVLLRSEGMQAPGMKRLPLFLCVPCVLSFVQTCSRLVLSWSNTAACTTSCHPCDGRAAAGRCAGAEGAILAPHASDRKPARGSCWAGTRHQGNKRGMRKEGVQDCTASMQPLAESLPDLNQGAEPAAPQLGCRTLRPSPLPLLAHIAL